MGNTGHLEIFKVQRNALRGCRQRGSKHLWILAPTGGPRTTSMDTEGGYTSMSLAPFAVNSHVVQFGRDSTLLFLSVSESSHLSYSLSNREWSCAQEADRAVKLPCFYLANMMLEFGLLVAGPVGLHLMVYISLLCAWRSWTHTSCFILQIWKRHW